MSIITAPSPSVNPTVVLSDLDFSAFCAEQLDRIDADESDRLDFEAHTAALAYTASAPDLSDLDQHAGWSAGYDAEGEALPPSDWPLDRRLDWLAGFGKGLEERRQDDAAADGLDAALMEQAFSTRISDADIYPAGCMS